jgi:hypothetical protein
MAPKLMNESTLNSSYTPYIKVFFRVKDIVKNDSLLKKYYSNNMFSFGLTGTGALLLDQTFIKSAEFDGSCIGARKGNIEIIDPEGIWLTAFQHVGQWRNTGTNAALPNMLIDFGWANGGSQITGKQKLQAITLKTAISMTDDGAVQIKIEFIENVSGKLQQIQFKTMSDIASMSQDSISNLPDQQKTPDGIMKYMSELGSKNDAASIAWQLDQARIKITFEATSPDNKIDAGYKMKIRLGDSFFDKVNELATYAKPVSKTDDKIAYSYEVIKLPHPDSTNKDLNEITYGFKPAPADISDDSSNSAGMTELKSKFSTTNVGTLYWKKPQLPAAYKEGDKLLISFNIDFKALDYASQMMQDELTKRLGKFDDASWESIDKAMQLMGQKPEYAAMMKQPYDKLASYMQNNGIKLTGAGKWLDGGEGDKRQKIIDELNQALQQTTTSSGGQMAAMVNSFVFKAQATIMGDPYFGTDVDMYTVSFNSDFTNQGPLASMFSGREWVFQKATHKFSEGNFVTQLELFTFPKLPEPTVDQGADPSARNNTTHT